MPDRATIEAARPKCTVELRKGGRAEGICARPLRWDHRERVWKCQRHGHCVSADFLARTVAAER